MEKRFRRRVRRNTIKTAPGIVPQSSKKGIEPAPWPRSVTTRVFLALLRML
jgi:hypothetical protein